MLTRIQVEVAKQLAQANNHRWAFSDIEGPITKAEMKEYPLPPLKAGMFDVKEPWIRKNAIVYETVDGLEWHVSRDGDVTFSVFRRPESITPIIQVAVFYGSEESPYILAWEDALIREYHVGVLELAFLWLFQKPPVKVQECLDQLSSRTTNLFKKKLLISLATTIERAEEYGGNNSLEVLRLLKEAQDLLVGIVGRF